MILLIALHEPARGPGLVRLADVYDGRQVKRERPPSKAIMLSK